MEVIFKKYNTNVRLIIHTAAQLSHDWAAQEPFTDFSVNAVGTLNMLEMYRRYCPDSVFIFTSTNKVYGDNPNLLPIYETMSIDHTKHSLFGASKVAADILVQEYGRYFALKTEVFRGGCLTGSKHSGTQLHGFLSYLMKCTIKGDSYTIFGYKGKQVRDNMHSFDLVNMFWHFYQNPRAGEVYNVGGGRHNSCSILEAILMCEQITGYRLNYTYVEANRSGDHIWYISDVSKFKRHYPEWNHTYDLQEILSEIYSNMTQRLFSQL